MSEDEMNDRLTTHSRPRGEAQRPLHGDKRRRERRSVVIYSVVARQVEVIFDDHDMPADASDERVIAAALRHAKLEKEYSWTRKDGGAARWLDSHVAYDVYEQGETADTGTTPAEYVDSRFEDFAQIVLKRREVSDDEIGREEREV